jgi:hypothetical protein
MDPQPTQEFEPDSELPLSSEGYYDDLFNYYASPQIPATPLLASPRHALYGISPDFDNFWATQAYSALESGGFYPSSVSETAFFGIHLLKNKNTQGIANCLHR